MLPQASIFVESLGWTLIHSLWQGAIIAMGLQLLFRVAHQMPSRIKYHISVAGFFFLFAWFAVTWYLQWQRLDITPVTITESVAGNANAVKTYVVGNTAAETYTEHLLRPIAPSLVPAFSWIVVLYLSGFAVMVIRLIKSLVLTLRTRQNNELPAEEWLARLTELKQKMLIDTKVALQFSRKIIVPVVIGVFKPVIIIPAAIVNQLSADQLEAILMHELAHIKRHDYLVNIIQNIVETILFFNPFMWFISAQIRREREHCCDDIVVGFTENPYPYATALAALETRRSQPLEMALAASGKKQYLLQRIKRIMEMEKQTFKSGKIAGLILVVFALGLTAVLLTPSFAQSKKEDKKTQERRVWISDEKLTIKDENGAVREYDNLEQWPAEERLKLAREYSNKGMNLFFGPKNRQLVITEDGNNTKIIAGDKNAFTQPPVPPASPAAPSQAAPIAPLSPIAPSAPASIPPQPPVAPHVTYSYSTSTEETENTETTNDDEDTDSPVNFSDLQAIITNSMKEVNWDSIRNNVAIAMKEVKAVDWNAIQSDIDKGMAEAKKQLNDPKVKAELKRAMAESKQQLAEAQREVRQQMHAMHSSTATMYRYGSSSDNYDKMLNHMERQNLIDRNEKYKIEKKGDHLYINGEEQPQSVYKTYKPYLNDNDIMIKGSKDNLRIDIKN